MNKKQTRLIYLASPYTKYRDGLSAAFEIACDATVQLMLKGHCVYSPIVHNHPLEDYLVFAQPHEFWMSHCLPVLERCDELIVLMLEGYEESRGVNEEIEFAEKHNIPIRFIHYDKGRIA